MSTLFPAKAVTPIYSRAVVIEPHQMRSVLGRDLEAGMVLSTGVILQVDHDPEAGTAGEARLEMPGADIHYVDPDEHVTVLARITDDALDQIALGTFIARAEQKRPRPIAAAAQRAVLGVSRIVESVGSAVTSPARPGRTNRGSLGQYADDVQHYTDTCPVHGETTFARHRTGRNRRGEQRFTARCLACHSDYNLDHPTQEDHR